jgi:hypothetical protein
MGTNFFWLVEHHEARNIVLPTGVEIYRGTGLDRHDPNYHLGKRSAAGPYCWDCNITLCIQGNNRIHFSSWKNKEKEWYTACPKCKKCEEDNFPNRFERVTGEPQKVVAANPLMVELGLNKPNRKRPTGVAGCSSFSWAQDPRKVLDVLKARPEELLVEDEYGQTYKGIDFLNMLDTQCPIHFEDSIGQQFS